MNKQKVQKRKARPPTDGTTEGFCEHFGLFDFRRVHLGPDHGTKRHFHTELVRDRERERGLAGAGRTNEEQRASREFARLYEFDDHTTRLEASESERHGSSFLFRKGSIGMRECGVREGRRVPRVRCSVL